MAKSEKTYTVRVQWETQGEQAGEYTKTGLTLAEVEAHKKFLRESTPEGASNVVNVIGE